MLSFRVAILGAAAALTLGTASGFARQESSSGPDPDSHVDTVSLAARTTCPQGPNGVHGACVSAIASTEGEENQDVAQAARVKACKAAGADADKSEKKPAKGD